MKVFNEDSIVVKIWTNKIKKGEFTLDQVPNISNLKDMVVSKLNKAE